jgi:membrane-associated phospholipid phosphatase
MDLVAILRSRSRAWFGHIAEEALRATPARSIFWFLQRRRHWIHDRSALDEEAARDVTALGSYAVLSIVTCAVVVYLFMAGQRTAALWLLGAVVSGVLLSNLLKLTFERPRPDLVPHAVRVFTSGFPSGHATLSAITYLTLGALLAGLHSSIRFKVYFLGLAISLTLAVNQPHLSRRPLTDRCARRLVHWCRVGRVLLDCVP